MPMSGKPVFVPSVPIRVWRTPQGSIVVDVPVRSLSTLPDGKVSVNFRLQGEEDGPGGEVTIRCT